MSGTDGATPEPLNVYSVVGLVVFGLLGVAGLFALPALRARGVGFYTGFWLLAAVELVAAFGVAASVLTLRGGRD
ncbi:MAG: hypothetical protein ABEH47_06715 [Haloferacaceae archaeon]